MSEAPKFDFSRIRLGNGASKFKPNEIALPKNDTPDTAKTDEIATQKTNTPDTAKTDEIATQKTNTPDTAKTDEIASQKTNTPDTAKVDEIASQKTNIPDTVKADEIATQKTNIPDTVKTDEIATQKTNTPDTAKADEVASQKTNTPDTAADKIATQKTQLSSEEQKNIKESAKEIQELLAPLKTTYPTNSDYEKQVFVNKFREEIRINSRVQEILTAGGTELIEIVCQPLGIPIEMGKKWLETAKRYQ